MSKNCPTLDEELAEANAECAMHPGSKIRDELRRAIAHRIACDGRERRGPWLVVWTAFHGGGVAGRHKKYATAHRRARGRRFRDCHCGCAGVVHESEYMKLPRRECTTAPGAVCRKADDA